MNGRRFHTFFLVLFCVLTVHLAAGQTTKPTTSPAMTADDQTLGGELIRGSDAPSKILPVHGSVTSVGTSGALDLLRIVIALAVVIGVILFLRLVVQNIGNLPGARRSGKLVSVLSRSIISPKQQVMVLQVGRRLIVVGDSCGHMNSLCEISDPDEIAELIGQTRQEQQTRSDRSPGSFGNLFRRANEPFSEVMPEENNPQNVESVDGVTSEDVTGLMDKVRMLQQQFKH